MMKAVSVICDDVMEKYKTTPTTATECKEELADKLCEIGMEPDCVVLWQVLWEMADDEEKWDSLSAEEQQGLKVPKGKMRKPLGGKATSS